jgi:hypothetical protein
MQGNNIVTRNGWKHGHGTGVAVGNERGSGVATCSLTPVISCIDK